MPRVIPCPRCSQGLSIPDSFRGGKAKCAKCGGVIEVPAALTEVLASRAPAIPSIERPRETSAAPPITSEKTKPTASGASLGLGIASLAVGCIAFAVGLFPCLGVFISVPLGILGLLLGIAGAVIAMTRRGAGIGFPIAGSTVNVVAMIVALGWFFGLRYYALRSAPEVGKQMAKAIEDMNVEMENPPPAQIILDDPPDGLAWTNAKDAIDNGDVRVRVLSVTLGKVPLVNANGMRRGSAKDHVYVLLSIENRSQNQEVRFRGWGHWAAHDSTCMKDNLGNVLNRVSFGLQRAEGQAEAFPTIQPRLSVRDAVVFSRPSAGFKHLHLSLPAQNFGGTGYLRFEIPAEMVKR